MRFPPKQITFFTVISLSGIIAGTLLNFSSAAIAAELPVDPDFVRTWEAITPSARATATSQVTTAKPVAKPVIKNTPPAITDADREAVARANAAEKQLLQDFLHSKSEQDRLKSLAEDSLQKYQAIQTVNTTLREELLFLDQQAQETKANIARFDTELKTLHGQIDTITNRLLLKEKEIGEQKRAIAAYIQAIYEQENTSVLQVLLSHKTFADSLDELQNMESLEATGRSLLEQLKISHEQLSSEQSSLELKKNRLDRLRLELNDQQLVLNRQQEEKRFLLDKTQGKEEEYQLMLQEFKKQMEQVEADIVGLQGEIEKIKTPDSLANIEVKFGDKFALTNPQNGAIWPVDAAYKGISAYFRDSGYQRLFGFPHSAIDIPQPPETPIRSPANGVVLHIVDRNDGGYSYLVLYHGSDESGRDITTVYGHLPKIFVEKGDIVRKGEIVALTGGMPGTKGTGPYYTGPHLHFEVRQNGSAIDPLTWLP